MAIRDATWRDKLPRGETSAWLRAVLLGSNSVGVEARIARVCDAVHLEDMPAEVVCFDGEFVAHPGACVVVVMRHRDTGRPLVGAARWNPSVSEGPRWRSLRSVLRKLHRESGCKCHLGGVRW